MEWPWWMTKENGKTKNGGKKCEEQTNGTISFNFRPNHRHGVPPVLNFVGQMTMTLWWMKCFCLDLSVAKQSIHNLVLFEWFFLPMFGHVFSLSHSLTRSLTHSLRLTFANFYAAMLLSPRYFKEMERDSHGISWLVGEIVCVCLWLCVMYMVHNMMAPYALA